MFRRMNAGSVLGLALVLSACGAGAAATPSAPTPATSPDPAGSAAPIQSAEAASPSLQAATLTAAPVTSSPSAFASQSPSVSGSPAGVADLRYGTLPGGTYQSVKFGIPLTLTVGDGLQAGWANTEDDRYVLELDALRNSADSMAFGLPTNYAVGSEGKDLLTALRAQGAVLPKQQPVTVGGLQGYQLEFVAPNTLAHPNHYDGDYLGLYSNPDGTLGPPLGYHIRLIVIDRGDALLIITVFAPSAAEFEILRPIVDGVLASVHFR